MKTFWRRGSARAGEKLMPEHGESVQESYFYGVGSHYKNGYRSLRHTFKNQIGEIVLKVGHKPSTLLDVGCAFGFLIEDAAESEIDAYGVDISRYALSQAPEPEIKDKVALGSAANIPFRDGIFEVVTAFEVVEHLSSPQRCLEEFYRILKDGGFLFLSTPIPNPSAQEDITHVSVRNPNYWISNLRQISFQITPFYHVGPFHRQSTKKWIRTLFSLSPNKLSGVIEDMASRILGRLIAKRYHKFVLVAKKKPTRPEA